MAAAATAVYWERQARPDSCRMHATNACLGRPAYTWASFMAMCDEFSTLTGGQLARAEYHAGNDMTLFGYALQRAGATWPTLPLAMYQAGTSDNKKTPARLEHARTHAQGVFVYNASHVWYLRRVGPSSWAKVDSLSGVTASALESAWRDGLGIELVFADGYCAKEEEGGVLSVGRVVSPPAVAYVHPQVQFRVQPRVQPQVQPRVQPRVQARVQARVQPRAPPPTAQRRNGLGFALRR